MATAWLKHRMIKTQEYDYLVFGAGVAGLAFAQEMAKLGHSVCVVEKEDQAGGLCRTLKWDDYLFDFSTHRFSPDCKQAYHLIASGLGERFLIHRHQQSRISIGLKFLRYPFHLPEVIRLFHPFKQLLILVDYSLSRVKLLIWGVGKESYRDWFVSRYGRYLYQTMCYPYTSKIWKCDPEEISSDWAHQRFPQQHLFHLLFKLFTRLLGWRKNNKIAPDTGVFYYPKDGFGEIPELLEQELKQAGGTLLTKARITQFDDQTLECEIEQAGEKLLLRALKKVITTIPLDFYLNLSREIPIEVSQSLSRLRYLNIIFIFIKIDRPQVTTDHWLYFSEGDIIFNRAVEFKNWSASMAPQGKTSLCLDVTCGDGHFWSMDQEELLKLCRRDLLKTGLVLEHEILEMKPVYVPYAYPIYTKGYQHNVETVCGYVERDKKVFTLGRTGMFRYNNSHYSIESGINLARQLSDHNFSSAHEFSLDDAV